MEGSALIAATDADPSAVEASTTEPALRHLSADARAWFRSRFSLPTNAQRLAWPAIARGENLLLCSPTGSGKTVAGLLPIIDRIGVERRAGLQCLYVAPLKALIQDACLTIDRLCAEIQSDGHVVRASLRTGDTSSRLRRHQLDDPPHVLLTTPESLAVLLTHAAAAELFRSLRWVVVDEVHALAGNKRGADLALGLERIETLTGVPGGVQRVGLSATCTPLATAAQFLVGAGRPCRIAQVADRTAMELSVDPLPYEAGPGFLNRLVARLVTELAANRTTLIFTNTRSLTERVTWALRQRYPERTEEIAAHHSALAPARRRLVERALKQGRLWAAVSSTTLELGIDVGAVDGVVFVHPPGSIVRLLQRLGRSGHRPGAPRRGLVLTSSARELLEAAVTADCGRHAQIETLRVPDHPYDVLCQHLVGMAMTGPWTAAEAYALVRRAYPFRNLSLDDFRACLDYLSGRHRNGTIWLPTRLRWEGDAFTITDERTARLLRRNLGTILTEEPCAVRMAFPSTERADDLPRTVLVGEVDDAYAERLHPGDRFMLDGRCLELRAREHRAIHVDEVLGRPEVPRWRGKGAAMSNELASRLYLFRVQAAESLREGPRALDHLLRAEYGLNGGAAASLARYFIRQETISEVPDFGTLLIECLANQACSEYYFHTPLPCPANEALARVVADRLARFSSSQPVAMAADLGFMLVLEGGDAIGPETWRATFAPVGFTADFSRVLRASALLRERFGQVAQTGLMVLRNPSGRRGKVGGKNWARERLFEQVREAAPDFLLLRQAEREAGDSACDLAAALAFVQRVPAMHLRQRWLAEPSPFADSLLASQLGPLEAGMAPAEALSRLQQDLLMPSAEPKA